MLNEHFGALGRILDRFNGTLRREPLNHLIVLNEAHLRRLLKDFLAYCHEDRTYLGRGG